MNASKGVVDVQVLTGHKMVYEGRVVRFLAGIESQVVEQCDTWRQLSQSGPDGPHIEPSIEPSLGSSEVGAGRYRSPPLG